VQDLRGSSTPLGLHCHRGVRRLKRGCDDLALFRESTAVFRRRYVHPGVWREPTEDGKQDSDQHDGGKKST
jgi:hypothetical protein